MKNIILKNEQLLSFLLTILISGISLMTNNPILFVISFIGGLTYHVIRGKQLGWSLPKQIRKTHSW
jgi:hypothetical protein